MIFSNDRTAYRELFFSTWQKREKNLPLTALEAQLIEIILMHPEYQVILNRTEYQNQEFLNEENPFLHMSLHLAIREQIHTNRPDGIAKIKQQLIQQYSLHDVEHYMMQCLAHMLLQAQKNGKMPSEEEYLNHLQAL